LHRRATRSWPKTLGNRLYGSLSALLGIRTWRRDNLFTTGGAENPTPTIVTMAIRQADYIADQLPRNNI